MSEIENFIIISPDSLIMKLKIYTRLSIAVIVIVALLRFFFALTNTVSGDACWHLSSAKFIAVHNKIPFSEGIGREEPFWPPPFFHFAAALFYKILGLFSVNIADMGIKLVSPVAGTLIVVITYLIMRRFFDEKVAFYSMIFLNFVPLFLDYSILSYVDSTAALFSILSVYLILNKRFILSYISLGIALLSKYNAVFMFPMLVYLTYKLSSNRRQFYSRILLLVFVPLLISSFWFIRNLILLGNPFWPFLNGIFHGLTIGTSFNKISFSHLLSYNTYLSNYYELFGVPNGNISLISFYNPPFLKPLLFIWAISTLLFIYPFIRGLFQRSNADKEKNQEKNVFINSINIIFLSYIFMLFIYLINTGIFGARLLLPIIPFMSVIWARGMNAIKLNKIYLPVIAVIAVIALGFIVTESIKFSVAAKEWGIYSKDFEWARKNTNESDLFYGNGQCLPYNIGRLVVPHTVDISVDKVDYVWVNSKWRIDFTMNEKTFNRVKGSDKLKVIYNNTNSGTTIYKVKQDKEKD